MLYSYIDFKLKRIYNLKTKITIVDAKTFTGFHHYKGKIDRKSNSVSFRICCDEKSLHRLFIKGRKIKSVKIDAIPDFKINEFGEAINWIIKNYNLLLEIKFNS